MNIKRFLQEKRAGVKHLGNGKTRLFDMFCNYMIILTIYKLCVWGDVVFFTQ
jgi:hypothetical protein